MSAARQEPAPQPQPVKAAPATRQAEAVPRTPPPHAPGHDEHAEEPGYGHGV
jgi:hypothetical protein